MSWNIEYDDDWYPTEESLKALEGQPLDFKAAARFILDTLGGSLCPYAHGETFDTQDAFHRTPVKKVLYSTGGWSGNEALIRTFLTRVDAHFFLVQWNRGGHYRFEIPAKLLE